MIRAAQIKVKIDHTQAELKKALLKALKINECQLESFQIVRKSIDARKKDDIHYVYTLDAFILDEDKIWNHIKKKSNLTITDPVRYQWVCDGNIKIKHPPIVVGTGPAGLYGALLLAESGFKPLVLERGDMITDRVKTVESFWKTNHLNEASNVQFGEGGAGTFSDGKLNTLVKDVSGRNKKVLEEFVRFGAPSEILYMNKPHIGTDRLRQVVQNMRQRIIELGGTVRFNTCVTDIIIQDGAVTDLIVNNHEKIPCQALILAIGHSARDTFSMLHKNGIKMQQKPFAIGLRMEHPQELINRSQYGTYASKLPAAEYKLTHQTSSGRGIYSFCMCPGGFVVNSSSELGGLAVNGMSNYARDESNANSALIVTVSGKDFLSESPLAGVEYQRKWEQAAFCMADGRIPIQRYQDFAENKRTTATGSITPCLKGSYEMSNLRNCLPDYVTDAILEGIQAFDKKIKGFANPDAILSGVETRTSSPVRIIRDELLQSNIKGIYPCGEGAGYAGGITSAAMDGLKAAEAVLHTYKI